MGDERDAAETRFREKLESAQTTYSEIHTPETRAAYLRALHEFADLVTNRNPARRRVDLIR